MKVKAVLFAGSILTLGVAGLLHFHGSQTALAKPEVVKTAAVVKVGRGDLNKTVEITAELHPYQEANVFAKIAGYLQSINVDVGDQVKSGQMMARLDLSEQDADRARAEATYHEAKLEYDRMTAVMRQHPGLLAQDDLDKAQAEYDVAKANMERARVVSGYAEIAAPFDGVVTKRFLDPGALVQAGTSSSTQATPLVHVEDSTKLRLILPVPESIVPQIAVGTPVTVTIPALNRTIPDRIDRVSGAINDVTRTMEVEVDLDNAGLKMAPGMYATAVITLDHHSGALTIPVQALGGKDKPDVWVINSEHKIEDRPVTTGIETPDKVEILKGLNEGETVVFGSRNALAVGMHVEPKLVAGGNV